MDVATALPAVTMIQSRRATEVSNVKIRKMLSTMSRCDIRLEQYSIATEIGLKEKWNQEWNFISSTY